MFIIITEKVHSGAWFCCSEYISSLRSNLEPDPNHSHKVHKLTIFTLYCLYSGISNELKINYAFCFLEYFLCLMYYKPERISPTVLKDKDIFGALIFF